MAISNKLQFQFRLHQNKSRIFVRKISLGFNLRRLICHVFLIGRGRLSRSTERSVELALPGMTRWLAQPDEKAATNECNLFVLIESTTQYQGALSFQDSRAENFCKILSPALFPAKIFICGSMQSVLIRGSKEAKRQQIAIGFYPRITKQT